MYENQKTEDFWKKKLSKEVFETLRLGKIEEPNTGSYVHENKVGSYCCRGCGAFVFDSFSKIEDGSGYATFKVTPEDISIKFSRSYTEEGDEIIRVLCSKCDGKLGFIESDEMKNIGDLEQGRVIQLVHVSSKAIYIKKNFTPENHPFLSILLLFLTFAVGSLFAWSWSTFFSSGGDTAQEEKTNETIFFTIENAQFFAEIVDLNMLDHSKQTTVFGEGALFLLLPKEKKESIRPSNKTVDVLWLDDAYHVIQFEKKWSPEQEVLTIPEYAQFALVTYPNYLPDVAFQEGYAIGISR